MIEISFIAHDDLIDQLGGVGDRNLLDRTLVGFDVREGRDQLVTLGLVPLCAISPFTYVWAVFHRPLKLRHLREFRRAVDKLDGLEWQTFLAEVCTPVSERFVRFMGFSFDRDLGDRKLYFRRF